jgi:hypothetical protein
MVIKQLQRGGVGANGGGICIQTDLGTYNNFIKQLTNCNNVFYPLND